MSARRPIRVLAVVSDPADAESLRAHLEQLPDYQVTLDMVASPEEAAAPLRANVYDLLLLGAVPGRTEMRLEALRLAAAAHDIPPLIVVAGRGNEREAVECIKRGASDYLVREALSADLVNRVIRGALVRHELELERNRLMAELRELSITDPLTGVGNRRFFMDHLRQELDRSERTRRPFSLLMIDLDHFKVVNDRFGHQSGDEVLRRCAENFRRHTRKTDFVARYGGEEFCIILPETGPEQARFVAEKLRRAIESQCEQAEILVTISVGVATWRPGDLPDEILRRADRAMYRAKELGRNRVVSFEEL